MRRIKNQKILRNEARKRNRQKKRMRRIKNQKIHRNEARKRERERKSK